MNKYSKDECLQKGTELGLYKIEEWPKCVEIRFGDLYQGYDCSAFLELVEMHKAGKSLEEIKQVLHDQYHSGGTYAMVSSMIKDFYPEIEDILLEKKQYIYEYPRPMVSVDAILFSKDLRWVLLVKRKNDPYAGYYATPGGFINENETLLDAAKRELMEETNVEIFILNPSGYYDKPDRDPRGRNISFSFYGIVDKKTYKG